LLSIWLHEFQRLNELQATTTNFKQQQRTSSNNSELRATTANFKQQQRTSPTTTSFTIFRKVNMLTTLLSSKPLGLALFVLDVPGVQSHNMLPLLTLLLAVKVFLACVVMLFAMLAIIVALACAFCAIVTKLSSDSLNDRTVI
jgi:hypothetical protein